MSAGLFAGLLPASVARADGVSDAQARIDAAQDKIDRLNEQASILEENLLEAQNRLVEAQASVEESKVRIAELECEALDQLQADLGDLALKTFINGDEASGTGSLLTGAGTITEVVERDEYARLALSEGQSSTDELDATLTDLDEEHQNLEARQATAEQLITTIENNQKATDKAENKARDAYAAAQQEFGQALVDRAAERQRQLVAKAAAAQAEAAARLRASSAANNAASNGGGNGGGGGGATASGSSSAGSSGNSGAGRDVPAPSPGASGAVQAAASQVGVAYRYASASPGEAFDCSGLTAWAWEQAGVSLPHQSRSQFASTTHVSPVGRPAR